MAAFLGVFLAFFAAGLFAAGFLAALGLAAFLAGLFLGLAAFAAGLFAFLGDFQYLSVLFTKIHEKKLESGLFTPRTHI